MKFIVTFTTAMLIASASHAEYVCAFQNSVFASRSFDSSWVSVKTVDAAIKMSENHTRLTVSERMEQPYGNSWVESVYAMCYNEEGNVAAFFKSTTKPNCERSKLTGTYDCKDLVTFTERLEK